MIQNAILYVLRKKKRTCILFIILTTVLSFLYSSLNIMKLSNNLENDLYKKYEKEIEYLYITHLLRSASYRFISVNNYKELLNRINLIFKKDYPNWHKNIYYKKSSFKLKLICNLSYYRLYTILKIIKKIKK